MEVEDKKMLWGKGNFRDEDCEISEKWRQVERERERERVGVSLETKEIKAKVEFLYLKNK